jgi:hypothetical protein
MDVSASSPLAATMPTTHASSQSMLRSSMISESDPWIQKSNKCASTPARLRTRLRTRRKQDHDQQAQAVGLFLNNAVLEM